MDIAIYLMLALKNQWSLSGSAISPQNTVFTTKWYSDTVVSPQITVSALDDTHTVVETGQFPVNYIAYDYGVDIWFRPPNESGTSYGSAKDAMYQARKEVIRIIRGLGIITVNASPEFPVIRGWHNLNETKLRPVLFRTNIAVRTYRYKDAFDTT